MRGAVHTLACLAMLGGVRAGGEVGLVTDLALYGRHVRIVDSRPPQDKLPEYMRGGVNRHGATGDGPAPQNRSPA